MVKDLPKFIDAVTFNQILEMDDEDPNRDFSKEIVFKFFDQVDDTIEKMKSFIKAKDFDELSSLGHYLKGSSATIGLIKIRDACEAIQNLGKGVDSRVRDEDETMELIRKNLLVIIDGHREAEKYMKNLYRV